MEQKKLTKRDKKLQKKIETFVKDFLDVLGLDREMFRVVGTIISQASMYPLSAGVYKLPRVKATYRLFNIIGPPGNALF